MAGKNEKNTSLFISILFVLRASKISKEDIFVFYLQYKELFVRPESKRRPGLDRELLLFFPQIFFSIHKRRRQLKSRYPGQCYIRGRVYRPDKKGFFHKGRK